MAAVGSFIDARSRGGRWLVRMEDLDRARVVPGSAAEILRTLEAFGLYWDGEVEYQSRRTDVYAEALITLRATGHTFECSCSRRELAENEAQGTEHPATPAGGEAQPYPGTCRGGPRRRGATAMRFRIDEHETLVFEDRFQGRIELAMGRLGDVIVRRRDGVFAYQLAVVVDDALQGITDVVRGADLLESTGWQMALQRALRQPTPQYAHLPLLLERTGGKLAKSRRSAALDADHGGAELLRVLRLLGLAPPEELAGATPAALLEWGVGRWRELSLPLPREVMLP